MPCLCSARYGGPRQKLLTTFQAHPRLNNYQYASHAILCLSLPIRKEITLVPPLSLIDEAVHSFVQEAPPVFGPTLRNTMAKKWNATVDSVFGYLVSEASKRGW